MCLWFFRFKKSVLIVWFFVGDMYLSVLFELVLVVIGKLVCLGYEFLSDL